MQKSNTREEKRELLPWKVSLGVSVNQPGRFFPEKGDWLNSRGIRTKRITLSDTSESFQLRESW